MESSEISKRIHSQILQLIEEPFLRKHLLLCPISSQPSSIRMYVKHFVSKSPKTINEQIIVQYPVQYPKKPPSITIIPDSKVKIQIPEIITKCSQTLPQNWKQSIKLKSIILNLVKSLDLYWENVNNFGKNIKFYNTKNQKNKVIQQKQQTGVQNDNHIQPKILALIYRLQQLIYDIQCNNKSNTTQLLQVLDKAKKSKITIDELLTKLFAYDKFRQQLKKQLINGEWIHKILKSSCSLIYKKYLISLLSELRIKIQQFQRPRVQNYDNSQMLIQ